MSRVVVASGGFERTAPRYVRYIAGGHPDNSDIVDGLFHIINDMDRDLDLIEESLKSNS